MEKNRIFESARSRKNQPAPTIFGLRRDESIVNLKAELETAKNELSTASKPQIEYEEIGDDFIFVRYSY